MQVLIAADSFKDALPALEVCKALAQGVQEAGLPDAKVRLFPLADGGESLVEVLRYHLRGRLIHMEAADPLGRPVACQYLLSEDEHTAFIEMAQASGLQLLHIEERNPLNTSTFGTGQMIAHAMEQGARHILIGLGGSATNDCGMGMAAALGYLFTDENGNVLQASGRSLALVRHIAAENLHPLLRQCRFTGLCDVRNPLFGPQGAARVYGPQKGADADVVQQLDQGLRQFSLLAEPFRFAAFGGSGYSTPVSEFPGAGAAGGLGAGILYFLNGALKPGIETIMELTGFEAALATADLVLTGEGRLDAQTMQGKLIQGIAEMAFKYGVPVIALCGAIDASESAIHAFGLKAAFAIGRKPEPLETALRNTAENLRYSACQVMGVFHTGRLSN